MSRIYLENIDNSGRWTSYEYPNQAPTAKFNQASTGKFNQAAVPQLQGEHISPTHNGEHWVIVLIVIIIIIAVLVIIFSNINRSNTTNRRSNTINRRSNTINNRSNITNRRSNITFNSRLNRNNQLRTSNNNQLRATNNNDLISTMANQNITPIVPNISNSVASSEIGSICQLDTDCRTQNCSKGFCQPHNVITGQTDAFCLSNGTPNCTGRFDCINSICMATGNDLFETCDTNNDCQPFHVCTRAPFESSDQKICQFPIDPNRCVNGTCTGGSICSGGQCLGTFGTPCVVNSNCVNSCGGPSIARWDFENPVGGGWSTIAPIPNNVKFERIIATSRLNSDDIWGLDPDNGLYYWKHDNPNRSWIQVLKNDHIGEVIGQRMQRRFKLIDFAVAHSDAIYVLYKVDSILDRSRINHDDYYNNFYILYRLDMMRVRNAIGNSTQLNNIDLSNLLIPYSTDDGIQFTKEGETFSRIIGIDAIMDRGKIITLLYGNCQSDGTRYYVFSHSGDDPYFYYVGPRHGYGLTSFNRIRLLPRLYSYYDNYSARQTEVYDSNNDYKLNDNYCYFNYGSSFNLLNGSRRVTTLTTNGSISDDPYDENSIELPLNIDIVIHDYVLVHNDNRISLYLIATYEDNTNIYFVPNINDETIHTLPGHVSEDSRIAASSDLRNGKDNLYIFTPSTCL